MSKSKSLCGIVRISVCYNQPWRGFTLQRGHFYGQTEDGTFFVSGLESDKDHLRFRVYLCDTSSGNYVWYANSFSSSNPIVKAIMEAIPKRKAMGIDKVEFKPLEKQDGGFHPRLTSERPIPYKHMHIPSAGRPTKTTIHYETGRETRIIQNYV